MDLALPNLARNRSFDPALWCVSRHKEFVIVLPIEGPQVDQKVVEVRHGETD
jgi:hypothetical protein